jgi:hypothetical protein
MTPTRLIAEFVELIVIGTMATATVLAIWWALR